MPYGYNGRILRVNLSDRSISVEEPSELFYRRYLGGWNFVASVLLTEMEPGIDPLGPENILIFALGVASGLPFSGSARNAVGAKSPLTGAFGASEVGGHWGSELKRGGFDAIIITGQADSPVYLWVHDGAAELRDAMHLWGMLTASAQAQIREELGDRRIRTTLIGPGGENLVRYACITNDLKHFAGRCGLGAVMGSKKLKAIATRGRAQIPLADGDKIHALARWFTDNVDLAGTLHGLGTGASMEVHLETGNLPVRNFRDGDFPTISKTSAQAIRDTMRTAMEGCYACSVRCKKVVAASEPYRIDPQYGGPEYEPMAALGCNCGIDDLPTVAKANEMCNAYTLDGISVGVSISFAMECFENGLLALEDTDGLDLRFGNADALIPMVEKIARREGIGGLLAEGVQRAAQQIGGGAERIALHVKGQEYPMHDPRLKRGLALGYALSPTGADHQHSLHDTDYAHEGAVDVLGPLGILEARPVEDFGPSKVRLAAYYMIGEAARNCAVLCQFVPWSYSQVIEIIRAATGWNSSLFEYMKVGERALTMARAFNVREGFTIEDDWLPPRSFEPQRDGTLRKAVDAEELLQARQLYYAMMGWDGKSGVPTWAKLHELDLSWVGEELSRHGKL